LKTKLSPGFVRHRGGWGKAEKYLWNNHLIAVHWRDLSSANPDDYEKDRAREEISNLNKFAINGGIIGASYRSVTKGKMLVGKVMPNSNIILLYFKNGELKSKKEISPGKSIEKSKSNDFLILKSLKLTEVKTISRDEYGILFESSLRPPFWSICEWPSAEEHLKNAFEGEKLSLKVNSLTTDQLEVLCEEYLRIINPEYTRLASIGGTTSDVDIIGKTKNHIIYAQVTFGDKNKVKKKIEHLKDYSEHKVIMFAKAGSKPQNILKSVIFLPIETVFETVLLNPSGRDMINKMLNRDKL